MTNEAPIPLADPPRPPVNGDLPPYLGRARRILSGDVRPDDYLPVTAEVQRLTDREMEWARSRAAAAESELDPVVERRQVRQNLLRVHCLNQHVAYLEDETGIVVLVTGLEESGELLRRLPGDLWSGRVALGYPNDDIYLL